MWTLRRCPGTCPPRSSPCECLPGLVGWGRKARSPLGVDWRNPAPPLQNVGTRRTPVILRAGAPGPAARELCSKAGSADIAGESKGLWPRTNHPSSSTSETHCVQGPGPVGGCHEHVGAPACDVTPRATGRRRESSRRRGGECDCRCRPPGQPHLQQLAPGPPWLWGLRTGCQPLPQPRALPALNDTWHCVCLQDGKGSGYGTFSWLRGR